MRIKTSELNGKALDWAVATIEGRTIRRDPMAINDKSYWIWEETPSGHGGIILSKSVYLQIGPGAKYSPSTNWEQAGPIMEKAEIDTFMEQHDLKIWAAEIYYSPKGYVRTRGSTKINAAMRCFVASKVGETVEIPGDLA